ncbi:hypothetical protein A9B99_07070 [Mangrovibacter phragmitis]|uniref:Uncharacterized protein n=1 Tax=Mangrovibacter phragmitis TaxID=1691903 RepID=A0A1B7L452_9ENTR|nr:hypothetical protein A9B99_07070 [Mangrovibacter phragmitis]
MAKKTTVHPEVNVKGEEKEGGEQQTQFFAISANCRHFFPIFFCDKIIPHNNLSDLYYSRKVQNCAIFAKIRC